jgi:hypothetical protein
LNTWVHNIPPYSLPAPFPYICPPPTGANSKQDLFYLPVHGFWKKTFCLFRISMQRLSLWHFHVL